MGFLNTNMLKIIEWTDDSKNTLVYKFPMEGRKIVNGSKLTVRESQVAIFVSKGKIADIFEPGMYSLDTGIMPILSQILALPYGFHSPIQADVYFINTKQFTNLKWGTTNPILLRDKEFGSIRLRGFGTYAFRVENPKAFLTELFGTNSTFETEDIHQYLKSMLVSHITDAIAESGVSVLDMAANLREYSATIQETIAGSFTALGLQVTNVVIENLSLPEEVEKAIDKRSSLGVMQDQMDTYVKYSAANAMTDAAKNPNGNNMAGMGVGLAGGVAMANVMKDAFTTDTSKKSAPAAPAASAASESKFCSECGASIPVNSKFCNECGAKQATKRVCPKCGKEVGPNAKFCNECGAKL